MSGDVNDVCYVCLSDLHLGEPDSILTPLEPSGDEVDPSRVGPVQRQLRDELGYIPDDLTFVFGHTHKPFEDVLDRPSGGGRVNVFNTGGWAIDSIEPSGAVGASILLLNERLDVACLRIFNDGAEGGEVTLDLRRPAGAADDDGFGAAIQACVTGPAPGGAPAAPWLELEARIHEAIVRRRRELEEEPR